MFFYEKKRNIIWPLAPKGNLRLLHKAAQAESREGPSIRSCPSHIANRYFAPYAAFVQAGFELDDSAHAEHGYFRKS